MFTDAVIVTLAAGRGGNGVVAWRREKYIPKGGPAGGNGGKGGSIILKTSPQVLSLEALRNRRRINAENGGQGSGNNKQGRGGQDLLLLVPCGTLVKDARSGETLYDLKEEGEEVLICKGGRGGKGNTYFKSPTHQAPNICTPGELGETKEIELELKLIADIGLIGMPNAGKSTLLSAITKVAVKIAPYPFTTLYPNLGFIEFDDFSRLLIADIPGIIANAHADRGLGLSFLKHIERTSLLVYVIDISGFEGGDPLEDFATLRAELKAYNQAVLDKPFLVVLNKTDVEGAEEHIERFRQRYGSTDIFAISALESKGLGPLLEALQHPIATASRK